MKITDVRLKTIDSGNELRALVSVTFDGCFVVHEVKVIDTPSGLFVAMPSRKCKDGRWRDIAHPITKELRGQITEAVLTAYQEAK